LRRNVTLAASAGLLLLSSLLLCVSLFPDAVSYQVGSLLGRGTITYSYGEGQEAVTSVVLELPSDLAGSIAIVGGTPGWDLGLEENRLTISGGSLAPGERITVDYHLTKYVEGGPKQLTATSTFLPGTTTVSTGHINVSEVFVLKVIYIIIIYRIWVILVALLGLLVSGWTTYRIARRPPIPPPAEAPPPPPTEAPPPTVPIPEVPKAPEPEPTVGKPIPTFALAGCKLKYEWKHQSMSLQVWPSGTAGKPRVQRQPSDDPLALMAIGFDRHELVHHCSCGEQTSTKVYYIDSRVRYEWEILKGRGGFIKINDDDESKVDGGEQVLYQPPDLSPGETEEVTIRVKVLHNDPTKLPNHAPVSTICNISISREVKETDKGEETDKEFTDPGEVSDEYVYSITVEEEPSEAPSVAHYFPSAEGECIPKMAWLPGGAIKAEVLRCPDEVCAGDHVVLSAGGTDTDLLELKCLATGARCSASDFETLSVGDVLQYEWTATRGSFPLGNKGETVVWRAPQESGQVEFTLKARDIGRQYDDEDVTVRVKTQVRKLGIDLVKTSSAWVPVATALDATSEATVYVCKDDKWRHPGRRKFIRLKLKRVSRELGVCMNYPSQASANKNPDLFFNENSMSKDYALLKDKTVSGNCPTEILAPNDNPAHSHHYLYAVSKRRLTKARPIVRCEDYGAVAVLEAMANCCVQVPPRDSGFVSPCDGGSCCEGTNEVKIPRDDNNNDIADGAPQDGGGAAGNADNDNAPAGDGYSGDGLTNYEEYRGFIVGGGTVAKRHIRTSTTDKDIFIYDEHGLGTGFFNQSGLTIHVLRDSSLYDGNASRVINFDRGRHSGGAQHGVRLVREPLGGAARGMAIGGPGVPRQIDRVAIDTAEIAAEGVANMQSRVIAHELGHAVNIVHHGQGPKHNSCGPDTEASGLQTSGDVNCVMRYTNYASAWCHGTTHHRHLTEVPPAVGNTFCGSANGTGVNNPGGAHFVNNASVGNCRGRIRVKDW